MYKSNIVATYDYYTLEQAKAILNKQKAAKRQIWKRKRVIALLMQKTIGLFMAIIGLILLPLTEASSNLLLIPCGLYLMLTKKHVIIYPEWL